MIKADFHMHSYFSGDSTEPTENMIASSIKKGLEHICFTEHMDYDFPYETCDGMTPWIFDLNVDSYLYELIKLREAYKGKMDIGFGIEIGMLDSCLDKNKKLINDYDFDFVIASSHICDNMDPWYPRFWEIHDHKEAIRLYFEDELRFINAYDDFDVYGHLDYITRYIPAKGKNTESPYEYEDFKDIIDEVLKAIIKNGKGIEINTSGLRPERACPASNPLPEIVKRYKELGGEIITVGADAHKAEHVAYEFDKAEEILRAAGFKGYHIFKKRKPYFKEF